MPRPTKYRVVEAFPNTDFFMPMGKPKCDIEEILLQIDELEAMRLKDIEELSQEECAEKMNVSRQTFQNIIDSARKKIAIALTNGYAIRISGGHFTTSHCKFKCAECGTVYAVNYEQDKQSCPNCKSQMVSCSKNASCCKKWCKRCNQE